MLPWVNLPFGLLCGLVTLVLIVGVVNLVKANAAEPFRTDAQARRGFSLESHVDFDNVCRNRHRSSRERTPETPGLSRHAVPAEVPPCAAHPTTTATLFSRWVVR
jgi:hypothetical protein